MKNLRERMEDDRVKGIISPSTELELQKLLIDNFIFGFGFSICLFSTIPLETLVVNKHIPIALSVALLLIINILRGIYLMGSLENGRLASRINRGDGDQICRDCRMRKGIMLYFLMLYCPYNPSRPNRVLQLIQHDLIANTNTSTHKFTVDSFKIISPSTEAKLERILVENAVCGFLCTAMFAVVVRILSDMEIPNSRVIINLLGLIGFPIAVAIVFVNGFLTALLDMGDADRVCKWLRMKLVSHFFLLHINTHTRMKNLLPLIDDELQLQDSLV